MALPAVIVGVAAAAAAAPEVINTIRKALDAIGFDRSCIVEVVNTTDERMKLVRSGHDSGTYQDAPPPFLEPRSTMVFSSRSTATARGAVGNVGFEGDGIVLLIDYSNPFAGDNDLDASFEGVRAGDFIALAESGPGNTNARLRCIVSYSDPAQYLHGPAFKTLRSANFPDRFIRHRNFDLFLEPGPANDDYKFEMVIRHRGADGQPDVVGIRSVNHPDRYLRHSHFRIKLEAPNGPSDFLWGQDTAFRLEPGLNGDNVSFSFRSVNYPDRYIRHRDFALLLEPADTAIAKADASFRRI